MEHSIPALHLLIVQVGGLKPLVQMHLNLAGRPGVMIHTPTLLQIIMIHIGIAHIPTTRGHGGAPKQNHETVAMASLLYLLSLLFFVGHYYFPMKLDLFWFLVVDMGELTHDKL